MLVISYNVYTPLTMDQRLNPGVLKCGQSIMCDVDIITMHYNDDHGALERRVISKRSINSERVEPTVSAQQTGSRTGLEPYSNGNNSYDDANNNSHLPTFGGALRNGSGAEGSLCGRPPRGILTYLKNLATHPPKIHL